MVEHLNRVVVERDTYAQNLDDVTEERNFLQEKGADLVELASPALDDSDASIIFDPSASSKHFDTTRDLKMRVRTLSDELYVARLG